MCGYAQRPHNKGSGLLLVLESLSSLNGRFSKYSSPLPSPQHPFSLSALPPAFLTK